MMFKVRCTVAGVLLTLLLVYAPIHAQSVVNVRDFGALGNGAHDDAAAIQAAIDALVPGQTLYVPAGTYLLGTSAGSVDQYWVGGPPIESALILRTNQIALVGDGSQRTVFKLMIGRKMRVLSITSQDVSLRDFGIDGNKEQRNGTTPWPDGDVVDALLYFEATSARISVTTCEIKNGIEDGVGFWMTDTVLVDRCSIHDNGTPQAGAAGISFSGSTNSTASNNVLDKNSTGIGTAFGSHNITVTANRITNSSKEGIVIGQFVEGGGLGANSGYTVTGNTLIGNGAAGFAALSIASASHGTISSNIVEDNIFDGMQFYNLPGTPPSVGWVISRNICSDTRRRPKRTQDWGIRVLAESSVMIAGNVCANNGNSVNTQIWVDATAFTNPDWWTANTMTFK